LSVKRTARIVQGSCIIGRRRVHWDRRRSLRCPAAHGRAHGVGQKHHGRLQRQAAGTAAVPVDTRRKKVAHTHAFGPSGVAQQPREGGAKTRHDILAVQRIAGAEGRGRTHHAHVGP